MFPYDEFMQEWSYYGDAGEVTSEVFSVLLPMLGIVLVFSLLLELVLYIFQSIGLYGMARQCRLSAPWLAFVPIANSYVIGELARRSCMAYGKRALPFQVLLPLGQGLSCVCSGGLLAMCVVLIRQVVSSAGWEYGAGEIEAEAALPAALMILLLSLVCLVISVVTVVFMYIALYRIYCLFAPESATLYTVLSILLSVTQPFLLFSLRNRQPGSPSAPPAPPVWNGPAV